MAPSSASPSRSGRPPRARRRARAHRAAGRARLGHDLRRRALRALSADGEPRAAPRRRVAFDLKFRVGFFSAGFAFTTHATYEEGKWLALAWTGGEPRGILLRFSLTPIEGESACIVETQAEFEVQSLGWLVKYFLKHHPEIQHGIFPGITLVLLDSIRRAMSE